jgi:hypothetical protein
MANAAGELREVIKRTERIAALLPADKSRIRAGRR